MKNEIITKISTTKDIETIKKLQRYLKYLEGLSDEDYELLSDMEDEMGKKAELICEWFQERIWELLFWNLCFEDLVESLENEIPKFIEDDKDREEVYLSGSMWRLAMLEWDNSFENAPVLKREINRLKKLIYK